MKKILNFGLLIVLALALQACYEDNVIEQGESCWDTIAKVYMDAEAKGESGAKAVETDFYKKLDTYQELVEENLSLRAEMDKRLQEMKKREVLSPDDLKAVRVGTNKYLSLRDAFYQDAYAYECIKNLNGIEEDLYYKKDGSQYGVNISNKLKMKMLMFSLSAALTLYDNYILTISSFYNVEKLRQLINSPDIGFEIESGELNKIVKNATSFRIRKRIRDAIKFFDSESPKFKYTSPNIALYDNPYDVSRDKSYQYLSMLVTSSPSKAYVRKYSPANYFANRVIKKNFFAILDELGIVKNGSMNHLSGLFGNLMGLYEERKGYFYKNEELKEIILDDLQPLDILLEKTPFRITDKFIPGYFGHVAIWVGGKDDYTGPRALYKEVWDSEVLNHNDIIKELISSGHSVLEALRSGVELNTLDHFMNIDDMVILRPVFPGPYSKEKRHEIMINTLIQAFRQFGKRYDFNFDVESTDKIVCSELAYITYTDGFDWPTENVMGRATISPDNVAVEVFSDRLEFVKFYSARELGDSEVLIESLSVDEFKNKMLAEGTVIPN